jgi:hypothetical protein
MGARLRSIWDATAAHWVRTGVIVAVVAIVVAILLAKPWAGDQSSGASSAPMTSAAPPQISNSPSSPSPSDDASTSPSADATPTTPSSASASSPTPAEPATPSVRHRGELVLLDGVRPHRDLDSPQSDPLWGTGSVHLGDGVPEGPTLGGSEFGVYTNGDKTAMTYEGHSTADYATCSAIGDTRDSVEVGDLDKGGVFCLRTSAGRYGRAELTTEPSADKIVIFVTIWQRT